ncbi:MAG: large subunit ribosomal protein L6 [Parcubacteria group bacterium Athens1014_10]|nr:MAG: large subunit ribosomal protein L6 [Parcubacteria group bacterium Athens1014_10]TSD05484.1 MAG: large subunit ribosomal protein L6 [Parcubacteria group bacterium Athens0714_12]
MSRLAKKPIIVPEDINIKIEEGLISVKGPKGELKLKIHPFVDVKQDKNNLMVEIKDKKEKKQKALQGTFYRLITNMLKGVKDGFEKKLEIIGVGFKAQVKDKELILNIGFSHSIEFKIPQGIEIKAEKNVVSIFGIDKQLVGETAARIRKLRKPEPYKGSGIKYSDEVIRRKAGKAAKAIGAK